MPQDLTQRMRAGEHDRVWLSLSEDVLPTGGEVTDPEVVAEDLRAVDLHATVDEDAAALRIQAPDQVPAVVVVVEDSQGPAGALQRIHRLHREHGLDRGGL